MHAAVPFLPVSTLQFRHLQNDDESVLSHRLSCSISTTDKLFGLVRVSSELTRRIDPSDGVGLIQPEFAELMVAYG